MKLWGITLWSVVGTLALGASLVGANAWLKPLKSKNLQIITLQVEHAGQVEELSRLGFDIAGVDLVENFVDVVVDADQEMALFAHLPKAAHIKSTPINAAVAPDDDYTTPDELATFLTEIAEAYPNITRLEVISQSVEGRDILALKITDNPEIRELEEPTVLFNAMHHAREVMTTEVAMDTIEYLVSNYGTDAKVTGWVDNTEIWVLPMLNPDGNNKVWTSNSMWRKNTQGGYGVDLNRNYPYAWNSCNGSSGSRFSDVYRGEAAASEPETRALMDVVARVQPVFNISYHSYSEMVLYPFGCRGERTATREIVEGVGQQLAAMLPSDRGEGSYEPGTPWEILYSVDGGDIDWMYAEHHVIPYVIELNASSQGFQPDYRWRQPTVEKLRTGWGYILDRTLASGVRGVVRDGSGRVQPDATVTFNRDMPSQTDAVTFKVKGDGTYHLVLNPGTYTLTFVQGERTTTETVEIADTLAVRDIEL